MEIISRNEAIKKGMKFYFTGRECLRGHISERYVVNHRCVECSREKARSPEAKEYHRQYREVNREQRNKSKKQYYQNNKEDVLKRNKRWIDENRDRYLETARKYWRRHYKENKAYYAAKDAKRRAAKLNRTLPGYEQEIQIIYEDAQHMRDMGLDVEVDHIIPLLGETVSGLHHPNNLQIILKSENRMKSNKLLPEHMIEIY